MRKSRQINAVPAPYDWESEKTPIPGTVTPEIMEAFQRRRREKISELGHITTELRVTIADTQRRIGNLELEQANTKNVLVDLTQGQSAQTYMITQLLDGQKKHADDQSKARTEANADRRVRMTAFISLGSLVTALVFGLITAIGRC